MGNPLLRMASMKLSRNGVHWVDLDPIRASELSKTRPAVIVSLDVRNRALETVVVYPLTSHRHPGWRSRLPVTVAGRSTEIAADQIRTVSKRRLGRRRGSLQPDVATALRRLLSEMYEDA